MRSSIYRAAIAAIAFSFPFTGAALAKVHRDFVSPPMYNGDHEPPSPAYQTDGQLDDLKVIVSDFNARVANDVRSGRMGLHEAQHLRAESSTVLRRAAFENRVGGGMIPSGQYRSLLRQIDSLSAQT